MATRMVKIGEEATVPLRWLFIAVAAIVGGMVPPLMAYSNMKHRVASNTSEILRIKRDARYAAEDAAWVRGRFDTSFADVQKERRQAEGQEDVFGHRVDDE